MAGSPAKEEWVTFRAVEPVPISTVDKRAAARMSGVFGSIKRRSGSVRVISRLTVDRVPSAPGAAERLGRVGRLPSRRSGVDAAPRRSSTILRGL